MTDQPDGEGTPHRFPPIPIPIPTSLAPVRPASKPPKPVKAAGERIRRPRNALGPFVPEANRPDVPEATRE
jgi:hypothetical protein